MSLPIIPDPMIELIMLNPADARPLFPPLLLGLLTRAVWSSVSTCFKKTIKIFYVRKIGENKFFIHIIKLKKTTCHRLRSVTFYRYSIKDQKIGIGSDL